MKNVDNLSKMSRIGGEMSIICPNCREYPKNVDNVENLRKNVDNQKVCSHHPQTKLVGVVFLNLHCSRKCGFGITPSLLHPRWEFLTRMGHFYYLKC